MGTKNRNHPLSEYVGLKATADICVCGCMGGFSRVLAYPKVFKSEQAARVQRHQYFSPFHDVQSEGLCTEDDPLRLHPKGQHHPILILRQKRQAAPEREEGKMKIKVILIKKKKKRNVMTEKYKLNYRLLNILLINAVNFSNPLKRNLNLTSRVTI